jgi:hypothetical protein
LRPVRVLRVGCDDDMVRDRPWSIVRKLKKRVLEEFNIWPCR